MSDPAVLFVKPKAISARDKKALQSAGIIVIEIDNPADAKFVRAGAELSGSELLTAAARAISTCEYPNAARRAFGEALCQMLLAKQSPLGADLPKETV